MVQSKILHQLHALMHCPARCSFHKLGGSSCDSRAAQVMHGSLPASHNPTAHLKPDRPHKPLTCLGNGERAAAAGGHGPLVLLQGHIVHFDNGLPMQQAVACLDALQVLPDLHVQTESQV